MNFLDFKSGMGFQQIVTLAADKTLCIPTQTNINKGYFHLFSPIKKLSYPLRELHSNLSIMPLELFSNARFYTKQFQGREEIKQSRVTKQWTKMPDIVDEGTCLKN